MIMGIKFCHSNVIVVAVIVFTCCCCTSGNAINSGLCIDKERQALLAFKQSVDHSYRHALSSWTGSDCCSWPRVGCNNLTGHVNTLNLSYLMLVGREVSPSLAELKHLTFLDLSWNNFSASEIPSFFGNFKSLTTLDLSHSSFAGLVPPSLGNLSTLKQLRLSFNKLLKIDNLDWLSQLSSLHALDLSYVDLRQVPHISRVLNSFPFMTDLFLYGCGLNKFPLSSLSCTNLTNVKYLYLSDNYFTGQLPDWLIQLPRIQKLHLSSNSFSGSIPSSFFTNNSTLWSLDLSNNQLNGSIPESTAQFSNLQQLNLQNNSFSGIVSEIHFNMLVHLRVLDMSFNSLAINVSDDWVPPFQLNYLGLGSFKFVHGFPRWVQTQKYIYEVLLHDAKISGSFYFEDIVPLFPTTIHVLDLRNCSISGSIPENIGSVMPNIRIMILSHNNISGRIPPSFCGLERLGLVDLANNHLSGDIPQSCWINSTFIELFDLSFNQLTGLIPGSIGYWSYLRSLHLSNNQFYGELPTAMESSSLKFLDLANNRLSGKLPVWVKRLTDLRVMNLRSNKLDGSLIHELCALSRIQILDLAQNNFTGTIPSCFRNFSGMVLGGSTEPFTRFTPYYLDSLNQVIKGREAEYNKILRFLTNLDLSSNNLVENIPEELAFLSGLRSFNLSHNHLTGSIPNKIGDVQTLESLDLAHNHLTGMIPQSISELISLAHLNLSYNNLSGKIPTGDQLRTLTDPSSIYRGNKDLCGIQIEKECVKDEPPPQLTADEDSEKVWFYIGLGVGIVIGFWGVCGVLVFKRTWRYTYFWFIENVYEMIATKFVVSTSQLKKKFDQASQT